MDCRNSCEFNRSLSQALGSDTRRELPDNYSVESTRITFPLADLASTLSGSIYLCVLIGHMSILNIFRIPVLMLRPLAGVVLITLSVSCASLLHGPAGTPDDIQYAQRLWSVLEQEHMVGNNAKALTPFIGAARPHGWVLELESRMVRVGNHSGFVVVKKNYQGKHLAVADVERDRAKYLDSISIMFQRAAGYDPENKDWFWVQYQPDGQLFTMRKMGMKIAMAGKIMKGSSPDKNRGCIYCHSSAGGGDYIFYPEITIP